MLFSLLRKQNHTDSLCRKPFFMDGSLGRMQEIRDSLGGNQICRTVSLASEIERTRLYPVIKAFQRLQHKTGPCRTLGVMYSFSSDKQYLHILWQLTCMLQVLEKNKTSLCPTIRIIYFKSRPHCAWVLSSIEAKAMSRNVPFR